MLTDRQQKYYNRLEMLITSESLNNKERRLIKKAKNFIDKGRSFSDSINALNLSLRIYQQKENSLSSKVSELYKDLIETYGEPDYRQLASMRTRGSHGAGFSDSGWYR
jgi:uncharacterized coiled-coil DUF342 family protein